MNNSTKLLVLLLLCCCCLRNGELMEQVNFTIFNCMDDDSCNTSATRICSIAVRHDFAQMFNECDSACTERNGSQEDKCTYNYTNGPCETRNCCDPCGCCNTREYVLIALLCILVVMLVVMTACWLRACCRGKERLTTRPRTPSDSSLTAIDSNSASQQLSFQNHSFEASYMSPAQSEFRESTIYDLPFQPATCAGSLKRAKVENDTKTNGEFNKRYQATEKGAWPGVPEQPRGNVYLEVEAEKSKDKENEAEMKGAEEYNGDMGIVTEYEVPVTSK